MSRWYHPASGLEVGGIYYESELIYSIWYWGGALLLVRGDPFLWQELWAPPRTGRDA